MEEEKRTYSFRNSNEEILKFTVRTPTTKEIEDSDVEYSKAFFKALKNGLPTRMVLSNVLVSTGAWTEDNDKEIEELDRQASLLATKTGLKGKEKEAVDSKISELDEKASNLRRIRNSYFSHCAESVASDAQRDYLVSCVTQYADSGERVWKDYESFINEQDGNILFRATYEYLMFSNGVPSSLPNEEEKSEKDGEAKDVKVEKAEVAEPKPKEESK